MAMGSPGTRRNTDTTCTGRAGADVDGNYRGRNVTTVNNTNESGDVVLKVEQIGNRQPARDEYKEGFVDGSRNGDGKDTDLEIISDLKDEAEDPRKPETPMEFTVVLDCVPENSQKVASLIL